MAFASFQDSKADIWAYGTDRYIRIVNPDSATRKERAKVIDYWKLYQSCTHLFGERRGVLPFKQVSTDWEPLILQASGCVSGAVARLAPIVGDAEAIRIIERKLGAYLPQEIIEDGLRNKARFAHMS